MIRTLVLAVLCAVLGAFVGSSITSAVAQRHQHTHAVMWLAQFHLQRLRTAGPAPSCQSMRGELTSLRQLQGELVQAFPALYQQDATFRSRADALGTALQEGTAAGAECVAPAEQLKKIEAACDDCHRDYR